MKPDPIQSLLTRCRKADGSLDEEKLAREIEIYAIKKERPFLDYILTDFWEGDEQTIKQDAADILAGLNSRLSELLEDNDD
jgi:hypothetical protein